MCKNLAKQLELGRGVILDSVYKTSEGRNYVYDIVNRFSYPILVIEFICSEDIAKKRISQRPLNDGLHLPTNDVKVYEKYKQIWEDVEDDIKINKNQIISLIRYDTGKNTFRHIKVNNNIKKFVSNIEDLLV